MFLMTDNLRKISHRSCLSWPHFIDQYFRLIVCVKSVSEPKLVFDRLLDTFNCVLVDSSHFKIQSLKSWGASSFLLST